jgi:hypothetical protein
VVAVFIIEQCLFSLRAIVLVDLVFDVEYGSDGGQLSISPINQACTPTTHPYPSSCYQTITVVVEAQDAI